MAKQLWEDEARDRFLEFLREKESVTYETRDEDVPVNEIVGGTNFDYLLEPIQAGPLSIALEIFRLTPAEYQLKRDVAWSEIVNLLKIELEKIGVTGYLIRTPHVSVTKPKRRAYVTDLARRLAQETINRSNSEQFEFEGYTITKIADLKGVVFSSLSGASFYDPISMARVCLDTNIEKKNRQLAVPGNYRRVLFIVNLNPLVDPKSLLIACSRFDFETYPNIDEVYYESSPGHTHAVFDKSLFTHLETEQVSAADITNPLFLALLSARLGDRDPHAFNIVRALAAAQGSIDWLSDAGIHALIPIAEAFLENQDPESALWIIRQLRFTSDANIRALLCWPIQKLIVKNLPNYYPELLDILAQYSNDPDETVRAHVPIPLTELATRLRSKNDDGSDFMSVEVKENVRALAFSMLRKATPAVTDRLASVFRYIRDLSDLEALEVVRALSANAERDGRQDAAALMLYFAIYRERQFPELGTFDPSQLRAFLIETLSRGRPSLRASVVWTIWRGLKEDVAIEDVLPYLGKITEGEYDRSTFSHLYRIISSDLRDRNNRLCEVFASAIHCEANYLAGSMDRRVWHFADFEDSVRITKDLCSKAFERIRRMLRDYANQFGLSQVFLDRI